MNTSFATSHAAPSARAAEQPVDMNILSFARDAGESLFDAEPSAEAIERYIALQGLGAQDLRVEFDARTGTATVRGDAPDTATREKIVLCCGNVQGVERVMDLMRVALPAAESRFHTVRGDDTLRKIAKQYYSQGHKYGKIFEANRPMLRDPERLYPGLMLRIPA